MNQYKRFKIVEALSYLLENLPSTQTNEIHNLWMKWHYREDEELKLDYFKECITCKSIFPIIEFKSKLGESKECVHCREYGFAVNGIKKSLRCDTELNKLFDVDNDDYYIRKDEYERREKYIQSIINKIPKEFIELKIIIVKTQKKLYYYDASKH